MIRALIRQDFLPATARGGGGAGGKQGQPKVKFHSQGPKELQTHTGRFSLVASSTTPLQTFDCEVRTRRLREGRDSLEGERTRPARDLLVRRVPLLYCLGSGAPRIETPLVLPWSLRHSLVLC